MNSLSPVVHLLHLLLHPGQMRQRPRERVRLLRRREHRRPLRERPRGGRQVRPRLRQLLRQREQLPQLRLQLLQLRHLLPVPRVGLLRAQRAVGDLGGDGVGGAAEEAEDGGGGEGGGGGGPGQVAARLQEADGGGVAPQAGVGRHAVDEALQGEATTGDELLALRRRLRNSNLKLGRSVCRIKIKRSPAAAAAARAGRRVRCSPEL